MSWVCKLWAKKSFLFSIRQNFCNFFNSGRVFAVLLIFIFFFFVFQSNVRVPSLVVVAGCCSLGKATGSGSGKVISHDNRIQHSNLSLQNQNYNSTRIFKIVLPILTILSQKNSNKEANSKILASITNMLNSTHVSF